MDRIEDCISFIVGKAAQQVARRAREKLEPHDVTPTQYGVLKVLSDADGQTGAELGARLGIDSATTTGVADRLAANGLLERRPDPQDRRLQRLFLTPKRAPVSRSSTARWISSIARSKPNSTPMPRAFGRACASSAPGKGLRSSDVRHENLDRRARGSRDMAEA